MAKVIGFDKELALKATCRKCAAIVEYVPNEVITRYVKDYGGGTDAEHYVVCPNCSKNILVKK